MPRNAGIGRTGRKHKKRDHATLVNDASASEQPRIVALEAAVAAAEVAARVAEGDQAGVRSWLDDVLKQVERQVQIDEDQAELEREKRDSYVAAAVACVEAIKHRTVRHRPTDAEYSRMRPFYHALEANLRVWSQSYPADKCDKCARHLAHRVCRDSCSKCGQVKWRRAWRLYCVFSTPRMICAPVRKFRTLACDCSGEGASLKVILDVFDIY